MGTALYVFANLAIFYVMYWAWKQDEEQDDSEQKNPHDKSNKLDGR